MENISVEKEIGTPVARNAYRPGLPSPIQIWHFKLFLSTKNSKKIFFYHFFNTIKYQKKNKSMFKSEEIQKKRRNNGIIT